MLVVTIVVGLMLLLRVIRVPQLEFGWIGAIRQRGADDECTDDCSS